MAQGPTRTPREAAPPPPKKKDIHDADVVHLLEQWEKDDDIEEGDLPEHKGHSAPINFSQIDLCKPESILKMTKKGKTVMMFVTVSGSPTEKETEEITSLWQGSLFNANYDVQRFIVGSDRATFMLRDGSYTWEIKDFSVSQHRCADVTLEGQVYPGKGGGSKEKKQNKAREGQEEEGGRPETLGFEGRQSSWDYTRRPVTGQPRPLPGTRRTGLGQGLWGGVGVGNRTADGILFPLEKFCHMTSLWSV